jgi:hypothetical protein
VPSVGFQDNKCASRKPRVVNRSHHTTILVQRTATGWVKAESQVDTAANVLTASTDQFGLWALMGETNEAFLPVILT